MSAGIDWWSAASRGNAVLARATRTAIAGDRYARYVELRRTWTVREAGWDLGICGRHARRYEARRRGDKNVSNNR